MTIAPPEALDPHVGFADLFEGRHDAWGSEGGGCVRAHDTPWSLVIARHLDGSERIGVYPIVDRFVTNGIVNDVEYYVKWGCVDLDIAAEGKHSYDFETEDEAHAAAVTLQRVLARLDIVGWIERTRSRGRHVWVFARDWVLAAQMRRSLLVACGVGDVPVREVNPKQERLLDGQLGNYVRLPYPGGAETQRVIVRDMDNGGYVMERDMFVAVALKNRSVPKVFEGVASLWKPPPLHIINERHVAYIDGGLVSPPYIARMIEEGPLEGSDRSTFLARLAHKCAAAGMDEEHALEALHEADDNVGKFVGRRDREQRLGDMVRRAYDE